MNFRGTILFSLIYCFSSTLVGNQDLSQLKQRAIAGDPWAQLNLGAAFDHGELALLPDATQAVHWYQLAASQGLAEAQFNLAHCLATGHGVEQDYVAARYWMHLSAAQGLADAQFLLGVMLDQGLGGVPDKLEAERWLKNAAQQGNSQALNYIKKH